MWNFLCNDLKCCSNIITSTECTEKHWDVIDLLRNIYVKIAVGDCLYCCISHDLY